MKGSQANATRAIAKELRALADTVEALEKRLQDHAAADFPAREHPSTVERVLMPQDVPSFLWNECGVRFKDTTLRKYRSMGGGPAFYKSGRKVFYYPKDVREWGLAQRSQVVSSTSEL